MQPAREPRTPDQPVNPEASQPGGAPLDIMLARRVVRWVLKHYARVYGTLDFEMPECRLVGAMRTRWRYKTTAEVRAAVAHLTEMGAFHARVRPPLPTSRNPRSVLMLRPSKIGCEDAAKTLDMMRNALPPEVAGRSLGSFVPNMLWPVLVSHGVPEPERRAAAVYLIEQVVKPHLVALGYTGPRPGAEPLFPNARRQPQPALPPVVEAAKALAALVAEQSPKAEPEARHPMAIELPPEPAPVQPVANTWTDAAGRLRHGSQPGRASAPPSPRPAPALAPGEHHHNPAQPPALYGPHGAPAGLRYPVTPAPTASPLALSPQAANAHLAKAEAMLARWKAAGGAAVEDA